MKCTNWICRACSGVISTALRCRSCGARYSLDELQYEWHPRRRREELKAARSNTALENET